MTLWEVDIYPAPQQPDVAAGAIASEATDLGMPHDLVVCTARGYLLEGDLEREDVTRLARELLADDVVERVREHEVEREALFLRLPLRVVHRAHVECGDVRPRLQVLDAILHRPRASGRPVDQDRAARQ